MLQILDNQPLSLKGDSINAVAGLRQALKANIDELGESGTLVSASSVGTGSGEDPSGPPKEPDSGGDGGNSSKPNPDGPRAIVAGDGGGAD